MLEPHTTLGKYKLMSRLGAGGMGEVWKAEDTQLSRTVAIKILPPAVSSDPEALARMRREARVAAQLYHPNIATIHAIEEVEGRLFIVMEYVEGEPLSSLIRRGGVTEADVCRIGRAVADALAEAHTKGIVHRDIKPDNIIVNGSRVKVLDFGIAKQIGGVLKSDDPTAVLTQQGMIVGTIHYMSPEQALGKPLDARTDLFSLGVVLYELATGRLPFRGETITETITKIVRDEPEPPHGLAPGMESIIHRCLEKDRERRFANAADLANALEAQMANAPTKPYTRKAAAAPTVLETVPRRWPMVAGVVFLVLAAAIGGFVVARNQRTPAAPAPAPTPATHAITVTEAPAPQRVAPAASAGEPKPAIAETATAAEAAAATQKPEEKTDRYAEGMAALRERRMLEARRAFQLALQDEALEPRKRLLAELGIAITLGQRFRARELARRVQEISPRDPDLVELMREFADDAPPPRQRPFRGRRP